MYYDRLGAHLVGIRGPSHDFSNEVWTGIMHKRRKVRSLKVAWVSWISRCVRSWRVDANQQQRWVTDVHWKGIFFTLWKFGETQELRTCFLMELCELISVKQLKSSLIGWELSRNYSTHFRDFLWSVNLFQCILGFRSLGACEQRGETLCCF